MFGACQELKNPWNDNKPVKISRDGQVKRTHTHKLNVVQIFTTVVYQNWCTLLSYGRMVYFPRMRVYCSWW